MESLSSVSIVGIAVAAIIFICLVIWALNKRRMVPMSEIHIVRSRNATLVFGQVAKAKELVEALTKENKNVIQVDANSGNCYYEWPVWLPVIGVKTKKIPLANFDILLPEYEAWDRDKLPFMVDVKAFFHIFDYRKAAERIKDMDELYKQLESIVIGATRQVFGENDLEVIMIKRSEYGARFTEVVRDSLAEWGVATVRNIELMDMRDSKGEKVIENIRNKKKSVIEKESRIEVAKNNKEAEMFVLETKQAVDIKAQEVQQQVGIRTAETKQAVGIADEQSSQKIQEQSKVTMDKQMDVQLTKETREADIRKQTAIIDSEKAVETAKILKNETVINAEAAQKKKELDAAADKTQKVLAAEAKTKEIELVAGADLTKALNEAKGIQANGEATASAEKLLQLATVAAQLELTAKVGPDVLYKIEELKNALQIGLKEMEARKEIGVAQAAALEKADVKIFGNNLHGGLKKFSDMVSPEGALNLGATLDVLRNTPAIAAVLDLIPGLGGNASPKGTKENEFPTVE